MSDEKQDQEILEIARSMEALLHGPRVVGRQHRLKKLARALVEALNGEHAVPTVKARAVPGRHGSITYVVDYCPYCHGGHRHSYSIPGDPLQRMADCFGGEYVLEVSDD